MIAFISSPVLFQSTFPHGERPFSSVLLTSHLQFQSTFPHGERQEYTRPATEWYGVSIHVPARGTTGSTQDSVDQYKSFNPRSRTGNDAREIMSEVLGAVSIHVPARGTTLLFYDYDDPKAVSIHVPARGTTPPSSTLIGRFLFQSTFPHGERRLHGCCLERILSVSIHVPARGTTAIIHKFPLCFLLLPMQLYQ